VAVAAVALLAGQRSIAVRHSAGVRRGALPDAGAGPLHLPARSSPAPRGAGEAGAGGAGATFAAPGDGGGVGAAGAVAAGVGRYCAVLLPVAHSRGGRTAIVRGGRTAAPGIGRAGRGAGPVLPQRRLALPVAGLVPGSGVAA